MQKNKGFTLIEILVSMIIFTVTLVLVLGMGSGKLSRTGLKNSANEVLGVINMVKGRAAKENRSVALTFGKDNYTFHYNAGTGIGWEPPLFVFPPDTPPPPDGELTEGITFSEWTTLQTVIFNSRGLLIDYYTDQITSNITLTLQSDHGEGIKIKILSYGGIQSRNSWRDTADYGGF